MKQNAAITANFRAFWGIFKFDRGVNYETVYDF